MSAIGRKADLAFGMSGRPVERMRYHNQAVRLTRESISIFDPGATSAGVIFPLSSQNARPAIAYQSASSETD